MSRLHTVIFVLDDVDDDAEDDTCLYVAHVTARTRSRAIDAAAILARDAGRGIGEPNDWAYREVIVYLGHLEEV